MIEVRTRFQIGTYLDYLGYLFPQDPASGNYVVSTNSDLGNIIIAYVNVLEAPKPDKTLADGEKYITLELPKNEATQNLCDKWLYISTADEARIMRFLKAIFNLDLFNYYQWAARMGYQKKEIMEMFCVSRKLITLDPYEALHKRVYRLEQVKMAKTVQMLYNKVKHFEYALDKGASENL